MEELLPTSPEQLASEHSTEIKEAIAQRFKLSHDTFDTMHVIRERTHQVGPGMYTFTVAHAHKGIYHVLGRPEETGLQDIHVHAA